MQRVTSAEIVRPDGLRIPKGQPVRQAGYRGSDGRQVYLVLGAAHFLPSGSAYLHDAIHYGIQVDEDETEEIEQ